MSVENVDPFSPNETEEKEREIIRSHRVKLTEYIHDITALFPFMKEKGVYSIDDCDVIRAEQTGRLKVDKFIDILFTKGPRAVGTFHEALATNYPGLFDYLTRLFTKAGIDLPESRKSERGPLAHSTAFYTYSYTHSCTCVCVAKDAYKSVV